MKYFSLYKKNIRRLTTFKLQLFNKMQQTGEKFFFAFKRRRRPLF